VTKEKVGKVEEIVSLNGLLQLPFALFFPAPSSVVVEMSGLPLLRVLKRPEKQLERMR